MKSGTGKRIKLKFTLAIVLCASLVALVFYAFDKRKAEFSNLYLSKAIQAEKEGKWNKAKVLYAASLAKKKNSEAQWGLYNSLIQPFKLTITRYTGIYFKVLKSNSFMLDVAISNNDEKIAVVRFDFESEEEYLEIKDFSTGKLLTTINLGKNISSITELVWSPDDESIAAAFYNEKVIKVWQTGTGELIHSLDIKDYDISVLLQFTPDGKYLISQNHYVLLLWNMATGQPHSSLDTSSKHVFRTAISPDGTKYISKNDDGTLSLIDIITGDSLKVLGEKNKHYIAAAFGPDGKTIATASWVDPIKIWNTQTGKLQKEIGEKGLPIQTMVFRPDGKTLATGGSDRNIIFWDIESGARIHTIGARGFPFMISFSPGGKYFIEDNHDGRIFKIDERPTKRIIAEHRKHGRVNSITISKNNEMLLSSLRYCENGTGIIWDIKSGTSLHILEGHSKKINSSVFNPNGKLVATSSEDHSIKLWDISTGNIIRDIGTEKVIPEKIVFSPDGSILASAFSDCKIKIWQIPSGELLHALDKHSKPIVSILYSHKGKTLITVDDGGIIVLWNTPDYTLKKIINMKLVFSSASISLDNKTLVATTESNKIYLIDLDAGKIIDKHRKVFDRRQKDMIVSPDGTLVISIKHKVMEFLFDPVVEFVDVRTGNTVLSWKEPIRINNVAFSPDGKYFAMDWLDFGIKIFPVVHMPTDDHIAEFYHQMEKETGFKVVGKEVRFWNPLTGYTWNDHLFDNYELAMMVFNFIFETFAGNLIVALIIFILIIFVTKVFSQIRFLIISRKKPKLYEYRLKRTSYVKVKTAGIFIILLLLTWAAGEMLAREMGNASVEEWELIFFYINVGTVLLICQVITFMPAKTIIMYSDRLSIKRSYWQRTIKLSEIIEVSLPDPAEGKKGIWDVLFTDLRIRKNKNVVLKYKLGSTSLHLEKPDQFITDLSAQLERIRSED